MECASSLRSETRTPQRISFANNFFLLKGIPARLQFSLRAIPLHERRRIKYAVHPILSKSVHQYYPGQPVEVVQRSDWGEALCQKDRASHLWFGWH